MTFGISCQQVFVYVQRFPHFEEFLSLKMNAEPKRWFYPAQVFSQFTTGDEKPVKFMDKQQNSRENAANTSKDKDITSNIIQIFETGELTIAPDYAQVVIVCKSVKDTVEEVKSSVNKRVDYVLQTLRSHNIGKNSYTVDRSLLRKESKYELTVEISAQFHDFTKCQEVSNFLIEKLDASVEISRPSFHYMPGKLESLRRQSCVLAVQNARVKALEIANSLNQSLGQARHINEESTEEFTGRELEERNTERTQTFQELIKLATVTVVTKVLVAFELKVKKKKRHK